MRGASVGSRMSIGVASETQQRASSRRLHRALAFSGGRGVNSPGHLSGLGAPGHVLGQCKRVQTPETGATGSSNSDYSGPG
jgi:hypothetical protein